MPSPPPASWPPALIAALALSAYASPASPQAAVPPSGQPAPVAGATDESLAKAVHAALDADPNYFYRHVNVRVDHGVAKLSGYVESGAAINRARKVAGKVPGIGRVETSHLQVDTQQRR